MSEKSILDMTIGEALYLLSIPAVAGLILCFS